MLLFVTVNDDDVPVVTPAGWNLLDRVVDSSMQTLVFSRVAAAGDAGTSVTFDLGIWRKADVVLAAYSGVDTASPIGAFATAVQSGVSDTHTTPEVAVPDDNSLIVSYWAQKTSSTTTMTTAFGATRHADVTSGGGRIAALLADSGDGVPAGTYGGESAVADSSAGKATMWTIALRPV